MSIKTFLVLLGIISLQLSIISQEIIKKKCGQCSYIEARQFAKFCIKCGAKLKPVKVIEVRICKSCNKILDRGGKFCAFCGSRGVVEYQEIPKDDSDLFEEKKKDIKKEKIISKLPKIDKEYPKKLVIKKEKQEKLFLYPKAHLLRKIVINEGLRRTSLYREVIRTIYSCIDNKDVVEDYYRSKYKQIQIMRVQTYDIFHILKIKFRVSKNTKIQIAYYSFGTYKSDKIIERKSAIIKNRLEREMKTVNHYKKEIEKLKGLIEKGHTTLISRIDDLKRRIKVASNSSTYWDLKALNVLCKHRQNILLITEINKK